MSDVKKSHRGLLHKDLGIDEKEPISTGELMNAMAKAKRTGNKKLEKRAVFAENCRK